MPTLDQATQDRLDRLRATDKTGIYHSDEPSHGADPEGALAVTLDPTFRIEVVRVADAAKVRTPDELRSALDAAWAMALAQHVHDGPDNEAPARERERPRAARLVLTPPPLTHESHHRHEIRDRENARPRRLRRGGAVGISHNECVTVTLPAALTWGRLEVDPGWLRNTSAANLGTAITEAYHAAYTRRDS